jgi:NAD+ diphosphatase
VSGFRYCPRCGVELAESEHGGRTRPACPREGCGYVHWDNPVPVVAAIVEREGHVLLVRNKTFPEKWFGLVTGFLERGETPEEGVLREVKEELGLDAELRALVGAYAFLPMNQLIVAYHVVAHGRGRARRGARGLQTRADREAPPVALRHGRRGARLARAPRVELNRAATGSRRAQFSMQTSSPVEPTSQRGWPGTAPCPGRTGRNTSCARS